MEDPLAIVPSGSSSTTTTTTTPATRQIKFDAFGPPEVAVSELTYISKIGQGCFGNVFRGECRGKEVAIKKLFRQDLTDKALRDFKREVEICSRLHHPNVVLFMGACTEPGELAIVTELLPKGNLEQMLHDPKRSFSLVERLRMARDVAQGMSWLHLSVPMIVHRDLKPSNLLVDANGRIKVCGAASLVSIVSKPLRKSVELTCVITRDLDGLGLDHDDDAAAAAADDGDDGDDGDAAQPLRTSLATSTSSTTSSSSSSTSTTSSSTPSSPSPSPSSSSYAATCDRLDFGLSCVKEKGEKLTDRESRGTPLWMSPEALMGRPLDEKADIYSFAIVLWEIATLDIPFHDATAQTFKRQICIENRRPPLTKLAQLPSLCDLLQRCWNKNPEVRPPFLEIVAALDNIILEAAISDEIGRNFWKVEIGGLDEVLWERFFRSFCTLLSVPYIDASDPKHILAKATFAKRVADSSLRDPPFVVSPEQFGEVVTCFGPIQGTPTNPLSILDRIYIVASQPYFHGSINGTEAEQLLQKQAMGTFLIRSSTTVQGSFTISKVNRQGNLSHQRIEFDRATQAFTIRRGNEVFVDSTLPGVISKAAESLFLTTPCPGSRFASLLFTATAAYKASDGYLNPEDIV